MFETLALTLVTLSPSLAPQDLPAVSMSGGKQDYVDFSKDLGFRTVSVVSGRLDKIKDGRRKRIKDPDAHVGVGSSVARVSGTQYYKAVAKTRILVDSLLAGAKVGAKLPMQFQVQLARMPGGNYRRTFLGKHRRDLVPGMVALWVVDTDKKAKTWSILHVLPMRKDQKRAVFDRDMRDVVAVNQRVVALRDALASAKSKREKQPEAAIKVLRTALQGKVELEREENDRLVQRHVNPWRDRLRKLLRELDPDADKKDGATLIPGLDGKGVIELPDGKRLIELPNGKRVIELPDGKGVIELPDKKGVIKLPDGRKVRVLGGGRGGAQRVR